MARLGIFCPPTPGHMNPLATLGRVLKTRGHTVTLFQLPALEERVRAQGLDFQPLGAGRQEDIQLAGAVARLGQLSGFAALRFTLDCGRRLAQLTCETGPGAIMAADIDLLLVDQNEPAAATVAEHLCLPYVSVAAGLPLNREGTIPPSFTPWRYRDDVLGRARNSAAYGLFDQLTAPVNAVLNQYRKRWNLAPIRKPDDTFSGLAQLCQLTQELDYPRSELPGSFHYTGPFRDNSRPEVQFPFERLNGKPLIYASFGTLQNGLLTPFQQVASACASLDAQLVIALGAPVSRLAGSFAGAPIVVEYAPQSALLARASLCITHGGCNTVLDALTHGVPMIAVPITNDQPAMAARVGWSGAGDVIPLGKLSVPRLHSAMQRVLAEPTYRAGAQRQQAAIREAGGVSRAADIVEGVLARSRGRSPQQASAQGA